MVGSKLCLSVCFKGFWTFSTSAVVPVAGKSLVNSEEDSIAVVLGQGAKSVVDTVLSRPSGKRICAKLGLASSKSTSSTKGSPLFRTIGVTKLVLFVVAKKIDFSLAWTVFQNQKIFHVVCC